MAVAYTTVITPSRLAWQLPACNKGLMMSKDEISRIAKPGRPASKASAQAFLSWEEMMQEGAVHSTFQNAGGGDQPSAPGPSSSRYDRTKPALPIVVARARALAEHMIAFARKVASRCCKTSAGARLDGQSGAGPIHPRRLSTRGPEVLQASAGDGASALMCARLDIDTCTAKPRVRRGLTSKQRYLRGLRTLAQRGACA